MFTAGYSKQPQVAEYKSLLIEADWQSDSELTQYEVGFGRQAARIAMFVIPTSKRKDAVHWEVNESVIRIWITDEEGIKFDTTFSSIRPADYMLKENRAPETSIGWFPKTPYNFDVKIWCDEHFFWMNVFVH